MYWYWSAIGFDSGSDACGCGGNNVLVLPMGICLKLDKMVTLVVVVVVVLLYSVLALLEVVV